MHRTTIQLAVVVAMTVSAGPADGAGRALVVGIDTYAPPAGQSPTHLGRSGWLNLQGASADAGAIHAILLARYGFAPGDVRLLQDRAASREAILAGLRTHLGGAKPGETVFFYYAGHGSQVRNSKSKERNQLDESLVPSDSWRGAPDIRDKELARAFSELLDAGLRLVVVFDSCHSGSASRGPAGTAQGAGLRARKIHPSVLDAADDYVPPSRKGKDFLAISASQDFQLAWEAWGDDGRPRGLFSLALQKAMQVAPPDEPVELLFRRVQSAVATVRDDQDPVLEGDADRLKRPLFGDPQPGDPAPRARTVVGVVGEDTTGIKLGAGSVVGLTAGAELIPVDGAGPSGLRLRVAKVLGPTRSLAVVVQGRSNGIKGGLLLSVDKWGPPAPTALRLHAPAADLTAAAVRAAAAAFRTQAANRIVWVDDPTVTPPTHTLARRGGSWVLSGPEGVRPITFKQDLAVLAGPEAKVFLNLPPPKELASVLEIGPRAARAPAARAEYHLVGRWVAGRLQYAWVRPWGGEADKTTLPARTDWFDATRPGFATHELSARAERLAKVHHWLTTDGPPGDGTFPYQLAIFDADTKNRWQAYKVDGTLTQGTRYNLSLVATRPLRTPGLKVTPRYVYVFVLDKDGKSTVILPYPGKGDVENRFPPAHDPTPRGSYKLLEDSVAWVAPPFGTDTYVLLTTKTKLPDPSILEGEAVRTRGVAIGGAVDRSDWSIRRVVVRSAAAP